MRRLADVDLGDDEERVLRALDEAGGAHLTRAALSKATGLSAREARRAVQNLRKSHFPICSTTAGKGGYWMATTGDEFAACTQRQLSRAFEQLAGARAMQRTSAELFGKQIVLSFDDAEAPS